MESALESNGTPEVKETDTIYSFTMGFKIFDQDAYELALQDLFDAGVWAEAGWQGGNTIAQNIELLVENLDTLADYRGYSDTSYLDIGIEKVKT